VLLADEPTGNLDEKTADDVLALARDLVTRTGCSFLMVTHSERLAATLDRRCISPRGGSHDPSAVDLVGLLSHWKRHRMQFAALLIGLISATALWSGVQAINQQARSSYDRAASTFGGGKTAMLVGRDSPAFPQRLFVDLRRANWPVSPVVEGRIVIGGRAFRLLGIEPVSLPKGAGPAPDIGQADLHRFVAPPGQTLVAPETLSDLKLPEGGSPQMGDVLLPPLVVQDKLAPGVLIVDIGVAQRVLKMPDQITRLLVVRCMANDRLWSRSLGTGYDGSRPGCRVILSA
jgi:energy-coupling factor transporter ATP-binding protein EcfA2